MSTGNTLSPSDIARIKAIANGTPSPVNKESSGIFSKSSLVLVISIMVIYAIVYSIVRMFLGERLSLGYKGIFVDILVAILVLYFIINYNTDYFTSNADPIGKFFVWLRNYSDDTGNIFLTLLFMIFFYLVSYVIQIPMDPVDRPYSIVIFNGIIWALLCFQILNTLCMVLFGFSIADAIINPFVEGWYSLPNSTDFTTDDPHMTDLLKDVTSAPEPTETSTPTPVVKISVPQNYNCAKTPLPEDGGEVFNISNNLYTYDDANAICQAFGARLATYDEVEGAYNDGGEWCNYGWSANQMALFPTQKETWNRLQQTATHKNDCGRPGVNGGYMENPNLKFGVNCYGIKPSYQLKDNSGNKIPINASASAQEQARIDYWKAHIDQLQINSFNMGNWTEYNRPPLPQTTSTPNVNVETSEPTEEPEYDTGFITQAPTYGPTHGSTQGPTQAPTQVNYITTQPPNNTNTTGKYSYGAYTPPPQSQTTAPFYKT